MATAIRKSIRINGKAISKTFHSKSAAEKWYVDQKHKKIFEESGTPQKIDSKVLLNEFFDKDWIPRRMKNHPKSTWGSDVQRFNDYVRPILGAMEIARITALHVRSALLEVTEEHELSTKTRDRVRVLISSIFNDAINRDKPLSAVNPTFGLRFVGKRTGKKKPKFLADREACLKFMKCARELGHPYLTWASLMLMSGMRSQEVIGLRWGAIDLVKGVIDVREKYIHAENRVVKGTKRGEDSTRIIPVSKELISILKARRAKAEFADDEDFVLTTGDGSHVSHQSVRQFCDAVNLASGLKATPHGLRHTFGREFAQRSDNLKALQDILGHSSLSTTEIYSQLSEGRLAPFKEIVSFKAEDE